MAFVLEEGRRQRPDFHVTADFVHPNAGGHVAIAIGMLTGLGEDAAIRALARKYGPRLWQQAKEELPSLSCSVEPVDGPLNAQGQTIRLRYWWTAAAARPLRRSSSPASERFFAGWMDRDSFPLRSGQRGIHSSRTPGSPEKHELTLEAKEGATVRRINATIPAPWLVAAGEINSSAWPGNHFDPIAGRLPMDAPFSQGIGLGAPAATAEAKPLVWRRYFPSLNYTGGPDPDSLDFWAVSFGRLWEVGYAARWIHSDRDRPVTLRLARGLRRRHRPDGLVERPASLRGPDHRRAGEEGVAVGRAPPRRELPRRQVQPHDVAVAGVRRCAGRAAGRLERRENLRRPRYKVGKALISETRPDGCHAHACVGMFLTTDLMPTQAWAWHPPSLQSLIPSLQPLIPNP